MIDKIHVVYCTDCREGADAKADDEEFIKSTWLLLADFNDKLRKGEITNYSVLAAWALFVAKSGT